MKGKRIPQEIKDAVAREYAGGNSRHVLAVKYGISHSSVIKITLGLRKRPQRAADHDADRRCGQVQPRPTTGRLTPQRAVEFVPSLPYYCQGCEATVNVRPCPACEARQAKKIGTKSAIAGVKSIDSSSYKKGVTPRVHKRPHIAVALFEIPKTISSLIHERLLHTIDADGRQESVDEAIDTLTDQIRTIIAAQANVIGEERRTANVEAQTQATQDAPPIMIIKESLAE